ncbi:Crp/Fnr family transcriptional regulator [Bradyrhizobium manausense]|uniref:Crp/Fnr family transcriptional regulator n=1 Tax=Bradyrhizobium manausense TaxID=989370 RepID=UPI001BA789E3|nr:Crp/Fnr family transcriptional regulator [Bradyrhizobium manausense]MBR0828627.1 Crp/Fnr family transcriptional regulator [Bradyrhizobium manausense]
MSAKEQLRPLAFWADLLSEEEASTVINGISERRYPAGSYICHRGDRFDFWTGIVTGLVKMSAVSLSGKSMTYGGVSAGGWFGEGTIMKNEVRKYDLVAVRDTHLAMLNRSGFMWLFENSVRFAQFVAYQLNERMGQFIATIESDRLHDPAARVARHLIWLFNPVLYPNTHGHVEITQEELGLLAGLSRQVTNRALATLEAEGLVQTQHTKVAVPSLDKLARYGSDDDRADG